VVRVLVPVGPVDDVQDAARSAADVLDAMPDTRRDDHERRPRDPEAELVDVPSGRRILAAVEEDDLDLAVGDEESVGREPVRVPRA